MKFTDNTRDLEMKKIFIVAMALIFTLPIFGCSKTEKIKFDGEKEIVFTAAKPLIGTKRSSVVHEELSCVDGSCDFYKEYSEYYKENFQDKIDGSFYMLKSERRIGGFMWQYFNFYAGDIIDGKYTNPLIVLSIALYDDKFREAVPSDGHLATGLWDNINLSFRLAPVSNIVKGSKFRLEFGIDESKNKGWYDKYFNLYNGETCIATCYYQLKYKETREPLTYKWFEDYLKENLILQA